MSMAMIHTEQNTDVELIKRNSQEKDVADADNNCVLLTTGSFNPVHSSHLKNLQLVKDHLETKETPSLRVLGGFLSPTHDDYVRGKLGSGHWISAKDRTKLCQEAIKCEKLDSWLSVARGEEECTDGFVDFDTVAISLEKFLNGCLHQEEKFLKHPLKVIYVCGLDHFNKCPYVRDLANQKNMGCAIIYRPNADEQRIRELAKRSPNIYYIDLEDQRSTLMDISSTSIRENHSSNRPDTTYPHVFDYLKVKYGSPQNQE